MELSSIVLSLIEIKFGAIHRAPTFAKLIFFLTFIASRLYLYGFNIYPRLLTLYSKWYLLSGAEKISLLKLTTMSTFYVVISMIWIYNMGKHIRRIKKTIH